MAAKPKAPIPATRAEADVLLRTIGNLAGALRRATLARDAKVGEVMERYAPRLAEVEELHKTAVRALQRWAERHKDLLIGDDRRSHDLSAGTLGWRRTPPAVKVAAEDVDAIIDELRRRQLEHLIRQGKDSLDKDAILKAPDEIDGVANITVESGEVLWLRPNGVAVEIRVSKRAIEILPLDATITVEAP